MDLSKIPNENHAVPLPNLNVNVNVPAEQPKNEIVKSEQVIGYYTEILEDIREDRKEIDEILKSFLEMVMNEGDATTSSKEALVNLVKLKSEVADKKTRVLDLVMRAYLKERDTFPKYLAAHQHNEFKIENVSQKRQLLKSYQQEVENGN